MCVELRQKLYNPLRSAANTTTTRVTIAITRTKGRTGIQNAVFNKISADLPVQLDLGKIDIKFL